MNYFFAGLFLLISSVCFNNVYPNEIVKKNKKRPANSIDFGTNKLKNINLDSEIKIYEFTSYTKSDKTEYEYTTLIVLSDDKFPFSQHKDSVVIASKYIGKSIQPEYHTLDSKHRANFLKIAKIKETDQVFIYNYLLNTMETLKVKDLPIMAHVAVDDSESQVAQDHYDISFDLQNVAFLKNYEDIFTSFIYIGKENPFQRNELQPIIWKKIAAKQLPENAKTESISNLKINSLYYFSMIEYDFYLINENHLVILDAKNKELIVENILLKQEYFFMNELTYENSENENPPLQYVGKLFKNKPPVYFGLAYDVFSSDSIGYIFFISNVDKEILIVSE